MENSKITKQNEKIRKKQEKQKQLEKVIESHSLKYYGYFNIIFQILIFFTLFISMIFSGVLIYQNRKLYNYLDINKNIENTTQAFSIPNITPYDNITDLTGTSWEYNATSSILVPFVNAVTYHISGTLLNPNENITNFSWVYSDEACITFNFGDVIFSSDKTLYGLSSSLGLYVITFSGGLDTTNSDLISWLQVNATLQNNTPTPTQLTSPVISRVDVGNDYYIQWPLVSNASDYVVILDNSVVNTAVLDYSVSGYARYKVTSTGTYGVIAEGDDTNYSDSSLSNTITFTATQLDMPTNFSFSAVNQQLTWSSVNNASGYYIVKDNAILNITSNTYYSISSSGSYQVYAHSSDFMFSDSSFTSAINIYSITSNTALSQNDYIYCNETLPYFLTSAQSVVLHFSITDNAPNGYFLTGNTYITTQNTATINQNITSDKTLNATIMNVQQNISFDVTYTTAIKLTLSVVNGSMSDVSFNGVNQNNNTIYYLSSSSDIVTFTATADNGYIYDNESGGMTYSHLAVTTATSGLYEKTITLTTFSTGATFEIEFVEAILLTGQWAFIGSRNFTYDTLPTYSISIEIDFTSNGTYFDGIIWNTAYQKISYMYLETAFQHATFEVFNYTYDIPNLYFSGFLYAPPNTANYLFIDFDTIDHDVYLNYNTYTNYFSKLYRVATTEDYNNLGYQNGLIDANQFSMKELLFALFDTPFYVIKKALNFNFFGVNLFALFTALFTVLLICVVYKFLKGGKHDSNNNSSGNNKK